MYENETTDTSAFGVGGDWCPDCGADWKAPHYEECPKFVRCAFPPGCDAAALPHAQVCRDHYRALSALFAPAD